MVAHVRRRVPRRRAGRRRSSARCVWIVVFLVFRYASAGLDRGGVSLPILAAVLLDWPWPVIAFCRR